MGARVPSRLQKPTEPTMLKRKRMKPANLPTPPEIPGFVAVKPKKGQWFVSLDREKVYGQVKTVREDGSFTYHAAGLTSHVADTRSRHSLRTWEDVQYDWGTMRFVDEVPDGFTPEGNDWRIPR